MTFVAALTPDQKQSLMLLGIIAGAFLGIGLIGALIHFRRRPPQDPQD